eukprot:4594617-Prymnesium_polylepis.1
MPNRRKGARGGGGRSLSVRHAVSAVGTQTDSAPPAGHKVHVGPRPTKHRTQLIRNRDREPEMWAPEPRWLR